MPNVKPFCVSLENPYHITGRCLNKEWFSIPMPVVWDILSEFLYFVSYSYDLRIHQFVLMGNHFHMIASSPNGQLSSAMQFFMSQSSRALAGEANRINHIWGARFYRSEITTYNHFLNCYKYNYRNPVSAGITQKVEDYRFSSLHGLLGFSTLIIPVEEDLTLFSDVEGTLSWLNRSPSEQSLDLIRRALKRRVFKLPNLNSRQKMRDEVII